MPRVKLPWKPDIGGVEDRSGNNTGFFGYGSPASDLRSAEQAGDSGYDDSDQVSNDNSDPEVNKNTVSQNESRGDDAGWNNNVNSPRKNKVAAKGRFKKILPGSAVGLVLGGGGLVVLLGPALAPFAFLENALRDLDDHTSAMSVRSSAINRFRATEASKVVLNGCGSLSIRCKYATISETQLNRMKRAGIEVIPEENSTRIPGRTRPASVRFQGKEYTAAEWTEALRTYEPARRAQLRANNMRSLSTRAGPFSRLVTKMFGLSRNPNELKGSAEDRRNQLLNAAGTDNMDNVRVEPDPDDPDKFYVTDQNGNINRDGPSFSSEAAANQAIEAARNTNMRRPPTQIERQAAKALGILGAADLACSIKNMIGAASVAAKIAGKASLISYAWNISLLIEKIKSGDATPEDTETLGAFLTDTDARREVADLTASIVGDNPNQEIDATDRTILDGGTDTMSSNPSFGKSAMDSSLLSMSINGGVAASNDVSRSFSLGVGINTFASLLGGLAGTINGFSNETCGTIQSWPVRAFSFIAGIVLMFTPAAPLRVATLAQFAGLMVVMVGLNNMLTNIATSGSVLGLLEDGSETVGRGDALWTGLAAIQGQSAQAQGLMPLSAEQAVAYQKVRDEENQNYIAMERETANPFDIYNQYSALGSISRSFFNNVGYSLSPSSILSVPFNLGSILSSPKAGAVYNDISRYQRCEDSEYEKLGIGADVQCNVRFGMTNADLNTDPLDAIDYMEKNNYVELNQDGMTETGLPPGYTVPDTEQQQNALMSAVTGLATGGTVGTRVYSNEYAKYLDACVYRSAPFGETYEEYNQLGGLNDPDWQTGKKCMEDSEMLSYFRVFTLDQAVMEAEEATVETESSSSSASSGNIGATTSGTYGSPVPASVSGARISARFGMYPSGAAHRGVDFAYSGDILSACDGVIQDVAINPQYSNTNTYPWAPGTTNYVRVRCDDGARMGYGHFYARDLDPAIKVGERISTGDKITKVGNQGYSTGPHLHFDVQTGGQYTSTGYSGGNFIDGYAYLKERGVANLPPLPNY